MKVKTKTNELRKLVKEYMIHSGIAGLNYGNGANPPRKDKSKIAFSRAHFHFAG